MQACVKSTLHNPITGLPSLTYVTNFITIEREERVINEIDSRVWSNELKRRVQHYGYKYDYTARSINRDMYVGPLPAWANEIGFHLVKRGFFTEPPDQLIINEYLCGQGISPHIDCTPCFSDTIVSLSLLSSIVMDITNPSNPSDVHAIVLEPRSLLVLSGEARYSRKHGIAARQYDTINGNKVKRDRRLSLTFRRVKIDTTL